MLLVTLVLLFVICAGTYVGLATWSRHERQRLGLRGGRVTAADDSRLGSATLRSERLGLVARPDHVLNVHGMPIPVEQKPSSQRVWPSHALQVSAPCSKRRLACDRRTRCWCSRTGSSTRSRLRPSESKSCSTRCSECATSWNRANRQGRAGRAAIEARLIHGDAVRQMVISGGEVSHNSRMRYLYESLNPARARRHVLWLQERYAGKCQICLYDPLERYGRRVCHAHHIQWLSRGGEDKLRNLVLVCPNHHAAIHQVDAPFDFGDLAFEFKKGNAHRRELLLLNSHLRPAA